MQRFSVLNHKGINMKNGKKRINSRITFFIPILIALILLCVIRTTLIANVTVKTGSMNNTIMEGDRLIVNRLAYKGEGNDVERYDIVVFYPPDKVANGEKNIVPFVKRVIGLPGETITIVNGIVYVTEKDGNTEQLRDDFVEPEYRSYDNFGPYVVPENSYFMLGDHRNDSGDSRFWIIKSVDKNLIIGKAVFRYYPKIEKLH